MISPFRPPPRLPTAAPISHLQSHLHTVSTLHCSRPEERGILPLPVTTAAAGSLPLLGASAGLPLTGSCLPPSVHHQASQQQRREPHLRRLTHGRAPQFHLAHLQTALTAGSPFPFRAITESGRQREPPAINAGEQYLWVCAARYQENRVFSFSSLGLCCTVPGGVRV